MCVGDDRGSCTLSLTLLHPHPPRPRSLAHPHTLARSFTLTLTLTLSRALSAYSSPLPPGNQTREETLDAAYGIFGTDNPELYDSFEVLLSRHLPRGTNQA